MTAIKIFAQRVCFTAAAITLCSFTAVAQQSLSTPPDDVDAVPELALPMGNSAIGDYEPSSGSSSGSSTREMIYPSEMIAPGGEYIGDSYSNSYGNSYGGTEHLQDEYGQYDLRAAMPAVTESSGTWLDRGFWYAEAEAVIFERIWSRDDLILATNQNGTTALNLKGDGNADAAVRVTLGRFLFRDEDNRNHSVEFSIYAGGDWTHDSSAAGAQGGVLQVSPLLTQFGVQNSFANATNMRAVYTSRFNNFEVNYRLKSRMRKDRMELKPTGEWVRRASPSWTREYLAGVRIIDMTERFRWTAQNTQQANGPQDGEYFIRTDNNMAGLQFGMGHAYETARWSVEGLGKIGALLNDAKSRERFTIENNDALGFNTRASDEVLNFVMEARLTGRYHLKPNFSLRAGLECFYLTNTAIATQQINFIPVDSKVATTGDPFFIGVSAGLDGYW